MIVAIVISVFCESWQQTLGATILYFVGMLVGSFDAHRRAKLNRFQESEQQRS